MQKKEFQAEIKADRILKNTTLATVLNFLAIVQIISFCVLLIIIIWTDSDLIPKILISDLIVFVFTILIYRLLCDTKK